MNELIALQEKLTTHPGPHGAWRDGSLPPNVRLGRNSVVTGAQAFRRFQSEHNPALEIGENCTMDGVQFALGRRGRMKIGDHSYFTNAVLLCEEEIQLGSFVVLGWNVTIADSDFHPLGPAERLLDTHSLSPEFGGQNRRGRIACLPVIVEDDVWIGPNATILKGVRIGRGAFIEPGAMVTRSVPAGARVLGNPAQVFCPAAPTL